MKQKRKRKILKRKREKTKQKEIKSTVRVRYRLIFIYTAECIRERPILNLSTRGLCSALLQSHSQFVRLGIVNKERAGGSAFLHQFVVCNAPASLTLKNLQTPQWVIWKQLPKSLKYDQLEDGNNSSRCQLGYKYKSPLSFPPYFHAGTRIWRPAVGRDASTDTNGQENPESK